MLTQAGNKGIETLDLTFIEAVKQNNVTLLESIYKQRPQVINFQNKKNNNNAPLHYSILYGAFASFKFLKEKNANFFLINDMTLSPEALLSKFKTVFGSENKEFIETVLQDIAVQKEEHLRKITLENKASEFLLAAKNKKYSILQEILQSYPDVINVHNKDSKKTALHYVVENGDLSSLILLGKYNIDPTIKDLDNLSPIDILEKDKTQFASDGIREMLLTYLKIAATIHSIKRNEIDDVKLQPVVLFNNLQNPGASTFLVNTLNTLIKEGYKAILLPYSSEYNDNMDEFIKAVQRKVQENIEFLEKTNQKIAGLIQHPPKYYAEFDDIEKNKIEIARLILVNEKLVQFAQIENNKKIAQLKMMNSYYLDCVRKKFFDKYKQNLGLLNCYELLEYWDTINSSLKQQLDTSLFNNISIAVKLLLINKQLLEIIDLAKNAGLKIEFFDVIPKEIILDPTTNKFCINLRNIGVVDYFVALTNKYSGGIIACIEIDYACINIPKSALTLLAKHNVQTLDFAPCTVKSNKEHLTPYFTLQHQYTKNKVVRAGEGNTPKLLEFDNSDNNKCNALANDVLSQIKVANAKLAKKYC